MKKKFLLAVTAVFLLISHNVFSTEPTQDEQIDAAVSTALNTMVNTTPESSLMLLTQSDAFIGKLFPSIPPHFAVGASFSGTLINTTDITNAGNLMLEAINAQFSLSNYIPEELSFIPLPEFTLPEKLPLPTAAVSARLGGFVIPFDIGLMGIATIPNVLDDVTLDTYNMKYNFMTLGADVRFALYEGGLIMPKISLGVGYIFSKQEYSFSASKSEIFYDEEHPSVCIGDYESYANMDLAFKTHTFFTQIQISKKIFFMTPYAGIRVRFTMSESGYSWNYKSKFTKDSDPENPEISEGSNSNSYQVLLSDFAWSPECINPTLFGGIGFKIGFFDLGLNVSWNMATNYFTFGLLTTFKM